MSRGATEGAPAAIDERLLRTWPLPALPPNADKTARGDVLVVGGSREVPGAVLLAGIAALRAGSGRLQLAVPRSVATSLAAACPEARLIGLAESRSGELTRAVHRSLQDEVERCRALVIGPGMGDAAAVGPLLGSALAQRDRPAIVLDAAALRALKAPLRGEPAQVIATPHAGEMAELWGCAREKVEANRLQLAREAARTLGVTLLLKGPSSVVATADGQTFISVNGNVGLATSGSGDVLAGLIAGLAARGASPVQATVWGVYLHAASGDALARKQGLLGYLARELSGEVPALLAGLERSKRRRPDRRRAAQRR